MSPSLFGLKVLGQSVTTGKLWLQQWEGTSHAESTVKKQKPGTLLLISLPPVNPAQEPSTGPGASHFRGGLPTSASTVTVSCTPQTQAQRLSTTDPTLQS